MFMDVRERDRIWEEMVERSNKRLRGGEEIVWRRERVEGVGVGRSYFSDLWLFVILLVFWISFVSIIEFFGL